MKTKPHTTFLFLAALILIGAVALRLWNLGTQSLWHDEAWSVFSAYHPLALGQPHNDPNTPPIYFMTLSLWQHLAGDGVWAMRYWSLLVGVITVAFAGLLTRRWFGDHAGLLAMFLFAVCPIFWVFSQEIRAYIFMPLLALLLLMLAEALLRPRGVIPRRIWLWLPVIELIALYTQNLGVPLIAWLNLTIFVFWLFRREWRRLVTWLAVQIGVGILYLPWLLTQRPTGTVLNTPPALHLSLIWDIWQSYFTGIKSMVNADQPLMLLTVVMGGVAVIAGIVVFLSPPNPDPFPHKEGKGDMQGKQSQANPAIHRRADQGNANDSARPFMAGAVRLIFSQALLIPLLSLIEILVAHIDFHPRYFIVGVPAALILIAVGLTTLKRIVPAPGWILQFGTAALAIGLMLRMMAVTYSSPIYQHDDFRSIAERYAKLGPDDAIIIPYGWEPTLDYYGQKMAFKAKVIGIPLFSSGDAIISQLRDDLKGVQHAELLTWYQLPADGRGAYSCIMNASAQLTDSLTVSGIKTDTYEAPSVPPLADFADNTAGMRFGPIQFLDRTGLWGINGLCAVMRWQLWQKTSDNVRISTQLNNDLGWQLARTDSDILNDRNLPTAYWNAQQTGETFAFLPVSPEAPPIDYSVSIRVYSAQMPNGYSVSILDNGGAWSPVNTLAPQQIGKTIKPCNSLPTPTIEKSDIDLGNGDYLHHQEIPAGATLQQGQAIPVTLEWWRPKPNTESNIEVTLKGQGWQDTSTSAICSGQSQLLTWHQFRIPADATGHVVLKAFDHVLAEYDITPIDRQFTKPTTIQKLVDQGTFGDVGTLIGVDQPAFGNNAANVTLYWQAEGTASAAYTVFVHLLDQNGNIIAQSDSQPVNGNRPTTNWLKGEYITDVHSIPISAPDFAKVASIRVGLYDQSTGQRLTLADKSDSLTIPIR